MNIYHAQINNNTKAPPIRLAILAIHPVQYHSPLYREICKSDLFDATVLYLDRTGLEGVYDKEFDTRIEWDIPLLEGHKYTFLRNYAPNNEKGFFSRINPGIYKELRDGGFDAILIQGYSAASFWIAQFAARSLGIKVIWRGEVTLKPADFRKTLRNRIRNAMIQFFLRRCDAILYTCSGNRNFLSYHGAPDHSLFPFLCAVDNNAFQLDYQELQPSYEAIRNELGVPKDNLVVLFCGRLTNRKRPLDVANAIKRAGSAGISFLVMGDGPQRDDLLKFADEHNVHLVHLGFVNQSKIARYYSIADVFCLTSEYDPSPKALNEAMNFAVVPIVSETIGTSEDLILDGETGYRVSLGNVEAIATCITKLKLDRALRIRIAQNARMRVDTFSFNRNVEGLSAACRHALFNQQMETP